MIKIGDFARMSNVTVKTLRHYGQLGLLCPVWIDRYTGYRFYNQAQLARLQRILALKEMGFSLEQIALLLDEALTVDRLRHMLALKRQELADRIRGEQARLLRVEARLNELEQAAGVLPPPVQNLLLPRKETSLMEPKIVTKPAFTVVGMRYLGKNQNHEISAMWDALFPRHTEIAPRLDPKVMLGVCDMAPDAKEGEFEYIAGAEVPHGTQAPAGMVAKLVPEQKYAVFEHHGPLTGLRQTYDQIYQEWLPKSGCQRAAGADFELYDEDFDPEGNAKSVLYLYVPIE